MSVGKKNQSATCSENEGNGKLKFHILKTNTEYMEM